MAAAVLNESRQPGVFVSTLRGLAVGVVSILALTVAFALVLTFIEMPGQIFRIAQSVIGLVGVLLGAFVATRLAASNGWLIGLLVGLVYALVYYIVLTTTSGEMISLVLILERLLLITGTGVVGGVLGVNL